MYKTPLVLPRACAVRRFTPLRVPDTLFCRLDHGLTTTDVAPFSKSVDNLISGFAERVFYIDSAGTRKPGCERSVDDLAPLISELALRIGPCNRVTGSEFLATRTGSKRKMYEQARDRLAHEPRTLGSLARLSFFTKFESTLWRKPQVPRIISPRTFEYNYLLGRYIRPVEHAIFDALAGDGTPVIAKGLTQQEKGALIADKLRPGWCCVGLDASRFDQSVGKVALRAEHLLYNTIFGCRLLAQLLKCQLRNIGVGRCFDGQVFANIGPMRCSGDQNTSLGNCLLSVLLARLFCSENLVLEYDILCDGDDLLLFVPVGALPKLTTLSSWYLRWGFRMKVEPPAYVPEQVEFCQSRPVCIDGSYVLVRNPSKVLNCDFAHGPRVQTLKQYLVHLRAVGVCGMSMAEGVPVLQELYKVAIERGETGKWDQVALQGLGYQAKLQRRAGFCGSYRPVSESSRESFSLAFGIQPAEQELLESLLRESNGFLRQPDPSYEELVTRETFNGEK